MVLGCLAVEGVLWALSAAGDWVTRARTTQRGRSARFLRALVHTRMDEAHLSGHKLGSGAATAFRIVEGYRAPDEPMVC